MGYKLENKGKQKIIFILLNGKITINKTVLRIKGKIDLEKNNLTSKSIIPFDEYLGIDKLPFNVSIKAMIEIALCSQNQTSFEKARILIKKIYGIDISISNVIKITEFIGKIVYNHNHQTALGMWNNRANIIISSKKSKGTLYMQADGATVNTRIEDENGSTWKENKLGIMFSENDMYKKKDKSNVINHKEYVSYIGNVETFKNKIIGYCYSREYQLILKELKKYSNIKIPVNICNLPVYIKNNKNKIDYSTYEHNGWFVGSEAIESSNKTIVQSRLKQAGMRWSVLGANYLIALRCMNESGNWDKIETIVSEYFDNHN